MKREKKTFFVKIIKSQNRIFNTKRIDIKATEIINRENLASNFVCHMYVCTLDFAYPMRRAQKKHSCDKNQKMSTDMSSRGLPSEGFYLLWWHSCSSTIQRTFHCPINLVIG